MSDVVELLRQGSLTRDDYRWKAADEIDRLRAAIKALNKQLEREISQKNAGYPGYD